MADNLYRPDFDTLAGEHIVLRKARMEDWQSMWKHVWGDEAVYRWMLFQPTLTEEDAMERCRRSMVRQSQISMTFLNLRKLSQSM